MRTAPWPWFSVLALAATQLSPVSAGTLEDMRAKNSLELCAHPDALPYSSAGAGQPGFYVDLAGAMATALGLPLKVTWITTRPNARFTDCDALAGVVVREHGDEVGAPGAKAPPLLRTGPYMVNHSVLVTRRAEAEVATLDSLRRLHVAVPSGSWAHVLLTRAEIPVLVRFLDDEQIIAAVMDGRSDAGIVSAVGLGWYQRTHPGVTVTATALPIADFNLDLDIGIGLRHADYATLQRANTILSSMKEDGTIAAILKQYGISYRRPDRS